MQQYFRTMLHSLFHAALVLLTGSILNCLKVPVFVLKK